MIINLKSMKFLKLIPILLFAALMASCSTTKKFEKLYYAKEYDKVIQSLAPDICKGDKDAGRINLVAASYHNANQADHERIQALKASGQPDVWPEIYQRYCSMKGRNDALACFPTKVKQGMNYVKLDLDDDMMAARNKAESFLVAKANQLLNSGSKTDAEKAQNYIKQLARTNRENKNLMDLRKKLMLRTADKVTLRLANEEPMMKSVADAILEFDEGEIPFTIVHSKKSSALITLEVRDVTVSPIRLDEVSFKETNGSKTVEVTDHSQNKTATISGVMEYRDQDGRLIGSVPFEAKSTFKNDYTTIKGDREACSAETLSRLNSKPVPVPTDESMLLDAAKKLNDLIATELKK